MLQNPDITFITALEEYDNHPEVRARGFGEGQG